MTTASDGTWQVTSPEKVSGNVFLSGLSVALPSGLPGGVKNVSWSGNFTTDTAGVSVNWQWAAAAYTQFANTDATALGVKASDTKSATYSEFRSRRHSGELQVVFVVGGGTGGGGSNWTGSYVATGSGVEAGD